MSDTPETVQRKASQQRGFALATFLVPESATWAAGPYLIERTRQA